MFIQGYASLLVKEKLKNNSRLCCHGQNVLNKHRGEQKVATETISIRMCLLDLAPKIIQFSLIQPTLRGKIFYWPPAAKICIAIQNNGHADQISNFIDTTR